MAEKKEKEKKVILERVYNIPLRKKYIKVPRWKRTNRAIKAVKEFVMRHMKSNDVRIKKALNEEIWKHGAKRPPHHIKVNCQKFDDNSVLVDLYEVEKKEEEIKVKDALGKEEGKKEIEGKAKEKQKIERETTKKKKDVKEKTKQEKQKKDEEKKKQE